MNGRLANVAVVGVVVAMLGSCGEAPQGVGEPVGGDSKYDEVMALPEGIRVKHPPEEFAGKFSCPDALLKGGQVYTERENWMRTSGAVEQAYLCYFIGEDVNGSRFRGTGRVDLLDVVKE